MTVKNKRWENQQTYRQKAKRLLTKIVPSDKSAKGGKKVVNDDDSEMA
jgi:hypothetical protein